MAKKTSPKKKWYRRIITWMWIAFIAFIVLLPLYIYSVRINLFGLYGGLPSLKSLENPKSDLSSVLYFADNVEMGKYYRFNRNPVEYENISPNLINALIATEDYRYLDHSGIDLRGLFRVAVFSVLLGQDAGGGSTISQQLAKILFRTRSELSDGALNNVPLLGLVIAKTKEWIVAVMLERSYTKKEILTMYLNTFEFGSNAFGVKTAANTFFNKDPSELTINEAAVLVGLFKNPNYYSPVYHPKNAFQRRNTVLNQMLKYDFINQEQYDTLSKKPINLDYNVENHNEGHATYFRTVIRWDLLRWCKENGYDLFEDGLKIYTTIDSRLQAYAEEAVKERMAKLQQVFDDHWKGRDPWIDENGKPIKNFVWNVAKHLSFYDQLKEKYKGDTVAIYKALSTPKDMTVFSWHGDVDTTMSTLDSIRYFKRFLQTGFMAMNPHNGHIKAWVGGINHKYFKYDHVKQGHRQPGSTFKPIVYAAAIDNGYSPCYKVKDVPVTFQVPGDPPTWTPSNAGGHYTGREMTLREALAKSVNSATAYVMKQIGPQTVVDYAKRLGIESPLSPVPALCLGVSDVSVYELVGAYSTFVNHGFYTKPFYITRIEDKNGNVLQQFVPQTGEALSEETAYAMTYMLRGSTEIPGGTGRGLSHDILDDNQVGAKTGTTQNFSDGWFMGVTKDLVAGCWVGGDDRVIHFRNIALGQGAYMALPIYEKFMEKVYADPSLGITKGPFQKPEGGISIELNCDQYDDILSSETDSLKSDSTEKKKIKLGDIF